MKSALSRDSGSGSGSGSLSPLCNSSQQSTEQNLALHHCCRSTGVKRNHLFNPTSYKVLCELCSSVTGSEQNLLPLVKLIRSSGCFFFFAHEELKFCRLLVSNRPVNCKPPQYRLVTPDCRERNTDSQQLFEMQNSSSAQIKAADLIWSQSAAQTAAVV